MLAQLLIHAFCLGCFYALVALGFSLIFGVTRAFNLAHGELVLLAGYLAYELDKAFHLPLPVTLPAAMLTLLLAALLLHQLIRHVQEPFELNTLVVTFGLALVLQNVMLASFSADYRLIRSKAAAFGLSWLRITETQLLLIGFSLAAVTALFILLRRTYLGKALRATIQEREAARLAGIQVGHMTALAFALGGVLIGLAGPLYGRVAYLHPAGGIDATLTAIIITIFAGVGRIRGILIGGWILGLVESLTVLTLGSSWREMVSALILIGLLLWLPDGFFSQRARLRLW